MLNSESESGSMWHVDANGMLARIFLAFLTM